MLESTKMLDAIEKLRKQIGEPMSHIEVARHAVLKQLADINKVEMPPILDEKQRKVFMDKLDYIAGYLESENGKDAIEFLVNDFEHYCKDMEAKPVVVAEAAVTTEEDE